MRTWLTSILFRVYLQRFLLLWLVGKAVNAGSASMSQLPPLGFRPATELVACAAQLLVLWASIRRTNEDLLIGNLGVGIVAVLGPLALVHFALSALMALLA